MSKESKFRQLESDFHDARHMAFITKEIIENMLAPSVRDAGKSITGQDDCYLLDDQRVDAALFCVYRLQDMIDELQGAYIKMAFPPPEGADANASAR